MHDVHHMVLLSLGKNSYCPKGWKSVHQRFIVGLVWRAPSPNDKKEVVSDAKILSCNPASLATLRVGVVITALAEDGVAVIPGVYSCLVRLSRSVHTVDGVVSKLSITRQQE